MIKKKPGTSSVVRPKSRMDRIRKKFQAEGGGGDKGKWFNIPEPESGQPLRIQIRVIPPWSEKAEGFFYHLGALHYGFSFGGRMRALSCPEAAQDEHKGKCPICQFVARVRASGDKELEYMYKGMKNNISQRQHYWVNVIDRADENKIKIYKTNFKFIQTIIDKSDDPDYGDVTDPQTGYDMVITRRGKGIKTRYDYSFRKNPSVAKFKMKDLYQLDSEVQEWLTYEQMLEALRDNYGDEMRMVGFKTEKKVIKKVTKKKKAKPVEEEEIEDEDIDEDEMDILEDDGDEIEDDEDEVEDVEDDEDEE